MRRERKESMANDEILYWHARAKRAEWRIRKEMKKDDQIKVLRNKLDYMEDRAAKAEKKVAEMAGAIEELKVASQILLRKVALKYGGPERTIEIPREDSVFDYEAEVTLDEDRNMIVVALKQP